MKMEILLTISICLNAFQCLMFWLLFIAFCGTEKSHKEQLKEIDEITEQIKERLLAKPEDVSGIDFPNSTVHKERRSPNDKIY